MERLSAADYLREAFDILAENGSEFLTIAHLCERLAVTKGSFYHHFGGQPSFISQLLQYWEAEDGARLSAVSRSHPEPAARIAALLELAADLPHGSEAALRAWGRSNGEVAEATERVDRRRERYLANAISAVGAGRAQARVLGQLTVDVLIGAQQREQPVDAKRLRQLFDEVTRLIELAADPRLVAPLTAARAG